MRAEDIKLGLTFDLYGSIHVVRSIGKLKLIEVDSPVVVTLRYQIRHRPFTRQLTMEQLLNDFNRVHKKKEKKDETPTFMPWISSTYFFR